MPTFRVWLILLALAAAVSGCSWMTHFIIVNETAYPVVVEYTLPGDGSRQMKCSDMPKPKIAEIDAIGDVSQDTLPDSEINCDPDKRTIRFELEPYKAAYLFRVLNYAGFQSEEDLRKSHTPYGCPLYPFESISIAGKYGRAHYAGAQLTRDFVKKSRGFYILTYR